MSKVREYYEAAEVDATWHCIWCMMATDPQERDFDTLVRATGLFSENAKRRRKGNKRINKRMRVTLGA